MLAYRKTGLLPPNLYDMPNRVVREVLFLLDELNATIDMVNASEETIAETEA